MQIQFSLCVHMYVDIQKVDVFPQSPYTRFLVCSVD